MTIQYSITPNEVTKSYFQQLRYSAPFRRRILLYAGAISLIYLLPRLLRQSLHLIDIVVALFLVVVFILLLPCVLRLFAKPQQRTLTIDAQGIHTTIGTQSGSISWSNVADLVHTTESIFIIGQTGNSFLIPNRAFPTPMQRQAFLDSITAYRSAPPTP